MLISSNKVPPSRPVPGSCFSPSGSRTYQAGYAAGLRRVLLVLGAGRFDYPLHLEAQELAWQAVYGPGPVCPHQLGYGTALTLLEWQDGVGYHWLGPQEEILVAESPIGAG